MTRDPIIEALHKEREEHARQYGYNVHAIAEALKLSQESSDRKVVIREPKRFLKKTG